MFSRGCVLARGFPLRVKGLGARSLERNLLPPVRCPAFDRSRLRRLSSDSSYMTFDPNLREEEDCGDLPRVFRPRRALPTDVVRPTRAEVDLGHLRHNLRVLQRVAGPVPIWGVLKADAYGHGAKAVARTLERAGMPGVCVALVEEGVELREAGIGCPILVMGGYYGPAYRELSHFRLTPVLVDRGQVEALARAARAEGQRIDVHAKVDTGMGRLGVRETEWRGFAQSFVEARELRLSGFMTHFACADHAAGDVLDAPLSAFERAERVFRDAGIEVTGRHAANSSALLRSRASHFEMARPGLALYGVDPLEAAAPRAEPPGDVGRLRPVMSVRSCVVALRDLAAGDTVGYGARFTATRPTRIATVPMGYADGLTRGLGARGCLVVRGRRAPIAGVVSMDMTTIDVSDIPGVEIGDDVVLLGSQKFGADSATISAEEIASWTGTIPWEVLTNISRRVPRFYRQA